MLTINFSVFYLPKILVKKKKNTLKVRVESGDDVRAHAH